MKTTNETDTEDPAEPVIDELFARELSVPPAGSTRRERILGAAKKEAGARDLFTHVLIRMWMPVLSVSALIFSLYHKNNQS